MEVEEQVEKFRRSREWNQFHNEKNLALSIVLESVELLECFQWKTSEEGLTSNENNIREELADIIIYSVMLANNLGVSIEELVKEKLKINTEKHSITKSKGKKEKYIEYAK